MPISLKSNGTWVTANNVYVKDAGAWKEAKQIWIKDSGTWKVAHLTLAELTISANTADYNIKDAVLALGWNGTSPVTANLTITQNTVVYSTWADPSVAAITTGESWPAGSTVNIVNNGFIIGMGGRGGGGEGYQQLTDQFGNITTIFTPGPYGGEPGGTAIIARVPTTIWNHGTIGGGGGGGGGSARSGTSAGSGGGGGRTGLLESAGGSRGGSNAGSQGSPGANGTFTSAGLFNADGGNWGAAGQSSAAGGGSAGRYLNGIANVTFANTGTRLGTTV